jgi:F-type H+-transporting ATPase subunit b
MFAEETPKVNGLDLFIPHPAEIFWSALVILILALAFYKFFLPTLNKILSERSEKIEGEIANAAKVKTEAQELYDKYTEEIKNARLEAAQIRDDARLEATEIVAVAHKRAVQDAELVVNNARRTIDSEKKLAHTQLKQHVASLAMNMTQKMLQNGLDNQERQSNLIDTALNRFENDVNGLTETNATKNRSQSSRHRKTGNSKNSATKDKANRQRVYH